MIWPRRNGHYFYLASSSRSSCRTRVEDHVDSFSGRRKLILFKKDLETVAGSSGIPLEDERVCVGPDTRVLLWYGRTAEELSSTYGIGGPHRPVPPPPFPPRQRQVGGRNSRAEGCADRHNAKLGEGHRGMRAVPCRVRPR